MAMKYKLLIIIIYFTVPTASKGQDPLFSQFYHSPMYLNPGLTGCGKNDFRAALVSRVQWMNLPSPMQYHTISIDKFFSYPNVSAGFIANHFSEGFIKTTQLALTAAKNFGSDGYNEKPWFLNFAMQFGFNWRNSNRDKLLFADQLTQNGPTGMQSQVELFQFSNRPSFDVSSGFVFTYNNFMIGGAVHHLNQPHNGLIGSSTYSKLPRRYTMHISFIKDSYSNDEGSMILKPTLIANAQGESRALLLGSLLDLPERHIEFGLWYRNNWSFSNNHAFVLSVNIKFGKERNYYTSEGNSRYRAGFSYDGELNKPGVKTTSGSAEMGILYEASNETCPKPAGDGFGRFPWEFH
jgi:type IX secretion system PorP/SprF family membrane protein